MRIEYAKASSRQLSSMGGLQMQQYRLLIIPGGNFIQIGNGITDGAKDNIRRAVHDGLNYLGICAGAFIAGDLPRGLNLTSDVKFGFYSAEARGIHKTAVPIAIPGTPTLDHYWEDGPQLSGWGTPIGTYPDGTPAIAEGSYGKGWVVLSGVHPEAPESWRRGMHFRTPAAAGNAYAATLIDAALKGRSLLDRSHHE